ncbi:MAG: NRDE family protein [Betaproteobacteria bacterium]|nr:NRDE family protein [Betaproteobacteria bacterium]
MCLALLAIDTHPRYRLMLAANRDEFYRRPSEVAEFWEDAPDVVGGRDLDKGGTWLGVTLNGRFALITNYREGGANRADAKSRGVLVSDFLRAAETPKDFLNRITADDPEYNGYNLIVGDRDAIWYHSNRTGEIRELKAGVYGLSNDLLDTPWPKVKRGKETLFGLLEQDGEPLTAGLFDMLADHSRPEDAHLPETGVGLEWERLLSAAFIASEDYGTRSSTVVLVARDGAVTFIEQSFGQGGGPGERVSHAFELST